MPFLKHSVGKFFGKVPLQTILIVPFVLQIVATVGLVGYFSWLNGQKTVKDLTTQLQTQISSRIYLRLEIYLRMAHQLNQTNANVIEQGLLTASDLPGIESFLIKQMRAFELVPYTAWGNEQGEYIGIERLANGNLQVEVVADAKQPIYRTYAVNNQGQRGKLLQITPFYDPRTRPWYKDAMQKRQATWSEIYNWFNQAEIAIDAVQPVYDPKGNPLGVLDTPLKLSRISDYLRQLKISKSGHSFIIERSGLLVATSDNVQPFTLNHNNQPQRIPATVSRNPLIQSTAKYLAQNWGDIRRINTAKKLDFFANNQRQFAQVLPFNDGRGIDWLIVVVVPESDFMEQINANTRTTIILCIIALIVAIAVGIFTARWITKPILRLNTSAKFIAQGKWDKTVSLSRSDEVGELAKSFHKMAVQLQDSFAKLEALNAALSDNEYRLQQFLEALPVGITVHQVDGRTFYANQMALQLLGKDTIPEATTEELVVAYQVYRGNQPYPTAELPVVRSLGGETVTVDDMLIERDGEMIPLEVRSTPIYDHHGKIIYAILAFSDISDRRRAEQEIYQLNQNLERRVMERTAELQAANQELEAFSYSVSHDLRSPLRAIDGFSEIILERYTDKLDDKGKHYLQRIRTGTQRMGELIDDLLTLSRVTRSEMHYKEVNLTTLALNIAERLQETQPERQVEWVIPPELIARGDERLLQVALENLLNNAWKFTSNLIPARIELNVIAEDGKFIYFVRDNGAGFDMTYADKLFGAFQRLHSATEFPGTGIGLATVQRIIHRHGGKVWAEAVVQGGATFYFTL